ncbi:hypothetical protein B484DRAFT_98944 [Ochromonadaceae sp. CCMP2298]|nr:hypothetical protein B484DRAFT_98944 [Ochromonadaceae sp. CCMP2298]
MQGQQSSLHRQGPGRLCRIGHYRTTAVRVTGAGPLTLPACQASTSFTAAGACAGEGGGGARGVPGGAITARVALLSATSALGVLALGSSSLSFYIPPAAAAAAPSHPAQFSRSGSHIRRIRSRDSGARATCSGAPSLLLQPARYLKLPSRRPPLRGTISPITHRAPCL